MTDVPDPANTTGGQEEPAEVGHLDDADGDHACGDPHCGDHHEALTPFRRESPKVGRNDPCPCGSGKKHKKCCLAATA
jgi:hypothetical protein